MPYAFLRSAFRRAAPATLAASLAAALVAGLAGCGGGDGSAPAADVPGGGSGLSSTLSGTVAVGAPIADGKLRVLDADGNVVAADIAVDANGRYADVALTGPAPYRIEACGYAGPNYQCVYSLSTAGGTANVTPLTSAAVLLAGGQSPQSLMSGAAAGLNAATLATAQTQLRASLASVLTSAGVDAQFDFVSGSLAAGSRSGYDGVLDAIGVNIGQDQQAFVQITPRLGVGNLYLEQGQTSGTVTADAGASTLDLSGLETLFADMSAAVASPSACANEATGIRRSLAANARLSLGDGTARGADQVAQGLCGFFGSGEDGNTAIWGARLLSPTLGRCDLGGTQPMCRVSFVLMTTDGDVQPVGSGMAVTMEAGVWKFVGDVLPIDIQASARAQRTTRVDSPTPVVEYDRAFAFEVAAVPGLACAKVSQHDAGGGAVAIAYYKRHAGATDQQRLSLWTANAFGSDASLDPNSGFTRSADDTWLTLPKGTDGDALIRNFYRGGRSVVMSIYGDEACSAPFAIDGLSEFEVEVEGVPPVSSALESLAWPELDADTRSALRTLAIDGGASGSLHAGWTFPHGPLALNGATVCGSRATCGDSGGGRIGERSLRAAELSTTVSLNDRGVSIAADDDKTFALYGRNGEGVGLESNFSSCPQTAAGEACH